MADTDFSYYILRYNQVQNEIEFFNGGDWFSPVLGNTSFPAAGGTFTGTVTFQKASILPTVTYSASTASPVTPDARLISVYHVTVNANLTINGPSNPYDGQKVLFILDNDGSHVTTFATGAGNFLFSTDIPSYTANASKTDLVGAIYQSTIGKWLIASVNGGF